MRYEVRIRIHTAQKIQAILLQCYNIVDCNVILQRYKLTICLQNVSNMPVIFQLQNYNSLIVTIIT